MRARTELGTSLAEMFPEWKIVDSDRSIDELTVMAIQLHQSTVKPAPYQGAALVDIDVNLIWPGKDIEKAEDALDDAIVALVVAFAEQFPQIEFTNAVKGVYAQKWPAYKFTTTVLAAVAPAGAGDEAPDPEDPGE